MSTESNALRILNVLLAALDLARQFQINYQQVAAMQAQAEMEGRELSEAERQLLLDQSQDALDQL